jgi:hypothetical protein
MSREIYVYAIAHDQPDGYFLVREKGQTRSQAGNTKRHEPVRDGEGHWQGARRGLDPHSAEQRSHRWAASRGPRLSTAGRNKAGQDADLELRQPQGFGPALFY